MEVRYYKYPDGSFSALSVEGEEGAYEVPADAVEITEAEYTEGVAAIEAANAQQAAAEEAAAQERARLDYEALIAAGIPAETAARMSGYQVPHVDTDPGEGALTP
ncbi:hypothetical protein ACFRQM_44000 [Streptomyces sp. NPDC056831]|uniref:hypothetical protein n=1 Tax=Streptomyces sp. NPDC056831 TaxID=3345954 RepID=UPI00368B51E9